MSFVPFDAAKLWQFSGVSSFYFVFLLFSLRQPPLFATNRGKAFDICRKEERQVQRTKTSTKNKGQSTKNKVQSTKEKGRKELFLRKNGVSAQVVC
jgi:hypothetical protein